MKYKIQNTRNNLSVVNLKLKASRVTTRIAEKKKKKKRVRERNYCLNSGKYEVITDNSPAVKHPHRK